MSRVTLCVEKLLRYAADKLLMQPEDFTYARNRILSYLHIDEPEAAGFDASYTDLQHDILDALNEYAIDKGLTDKAGLINFETNLMTLVTPLPSVVTAHFDDLVMDEGMNAALLWFYQFCSDCNYIRRVDIDKNVYWLHKGKLGDVGITVNLSKPEKDPAENARLAKIKTVGYPKCMLCPENVGFVGNEKHPSRATLRVLPISLMGENWYFQFSPYCYYEQHCIALSDEHRVMKVDGDCITRLLDFVELFPEYFIGSNAALPIVGGSILTHDHYQGGLKVLPLFSRKSRVDLFYDAFPSVQVSMVDWYNSVIRVSGKNRKEVLNAAIGVMNKWKEYSDESVAIRSNTDGVPHNAVTPIARMVDREYVVDLILRNNRTDEKYPCGIFHPTEDLHNIKKEGIGLIEAMGLFILPGRLIAESQVIKDYLLDRRPFNIAELASADNPMSKHLGMIGQLMIDKAARTEGKMDDEDAENAITDYINNACERILECTAVFKNTPDGQKAFMKFLYSVGINTLDNHLENKSIETAMAELNAPKVEPAPEPVIQEKRGRGRPKKETSAPAHKEESAPEPQSTEPASDTAAPKRRGRPPKKQ